VPLIVVYRLAVVQMALVSGQLFTPAGLTVSMDVFSSSRDVITYKL